jgi:hypothetical protein
LQSTFLRIIALYALLSNFFPHQTTLIKATNDSVPLLPVYVWVFRSFLSCSFLQYWGWNSEFYTWKAGTLLLEPYIQTHFTLVNLEIGSCFLSRPAWTLILLFYAFCSLWNDKACATLPNFFSIEIGSHKLFFFAQGGLEPWSLHSSLFQPPVQLDMTDMCHLAQLLVEKGSQNSLPRLTLI